MPRLTFYGAARTVTGSRYLLEAGGARLLIDCGLFQGLKELRLKNWDKLPFDPASLDAVVLTHAHIDHTGYLPRLVRSGFRGPIIATPPTVELTELLLFDSARNQEEDAEYANRKGFSKHHPALPLYGSDDVPPVVRRLQGRERGEWFSPAGPIWLRYHDAGHLLGSSLIEVEVRQGSRPTRLVFSGDVGRYRAPLYHDPAPPPACDYLICESTYGDREHPPGDILDQVAALVVESVRRGGVMVVAAFAVGRAQQLIYILRVLMAQGRIPELSIYLDSPMAVNATNIYADFATEHDLSEAQLAGPQSAFNGRNVHLVRTSAESKRLNQLPGPAVIISSSGMMTGGRILHHLRQRLPDERNTVVLGGFMAAGTRGRSLQDGVPTLRMHGQNIPVRAAIRSLSCLSGHAGRSELLRWLAPLPAPRQVFLTHGEVTSAEALAADLRTTRGWNVTVPALGESLSWEPEP